MVTFQQAQTAIQAVSRKVFLSRFAFIPLCLVAGLLLLVAGSWVCGAFLVLSLFLQGVIFRRGAKAFSDEFNHYRVLMALAPVLDGVQHDHKAGIAHETLRGARLVPVMDKGSITTGELTTGIADGMPVQICDLSMVNRYEDGGTPHVDPSVGSWVTITLPADTGANWRLINKRAYNEKSRRSYFAKQADLEKVETGIDWLDEKFHFYRPVGSSQMPGENMLKQLRSLQEYTPGEVCLALEGSTLHVFLHKRMLCFRQNYLPKFTEEMLRSTPLPELEYLVRMAKLANG